MTTTRKSNKKELQGLEESQGVNKRFTRLKKCQEVER